MSPLKIGCLAPLCDKDFLLQSSHAAGDIRTSFVLTERVEGCSVWAWRMFPRYCYADEHGRVQVNMTNSEFVEKGMENWMYGERVVMVRGKHCPDGSVIMHDRADDTTS